MMWRFVPLFLFIGRSQACLDRKAEFGKICVCNEGYCDDVSLGRVSVGKIKVFLTSSENPGFHVREENFFGTRNGATVGISVKPNVTFQKILGFGGALTDSAALNIKLLPESLQGKLLANYFSDDGIEYSMTRVTLGGSDFSPSFYSLDDHDGDDFELKHFALHEEDLNLKIPLLKEAFGFRKNKTLRLFSSTWTIPAWMRHSPGYTIVKETHYQVYADYYIKYFDEMLKHGIKFYGMTTQNEAPAGLKSDGIAGVFWVPQELNIWVRDYLGPTLKNSTHDIKVLLHDDNWGGLAFIANPVVNDGKTIQYIEALATHWYSWGNVPLEVLNLTKSNSKNLMLINSEASYFNTRPYLGDWQRASNYVKTVLTHLQNGFNAWVDWNIVVDESGGPNSLNLTADAPIVISADRKEFFKQPMFYTFGHISKFVPSGSVRVDVTVSKDVFNDIQIIAFLRPDNLTSIIVHNMNNIMGTKIQVIDEGRCTDVMEVPPSSIQTFIY